MRRGFLFIVALTLTTVVLPADIFITKSTSYYKSPGNVEEIGEIPKDTILPDTNLYKVMDNALYYLISYNGINGWVNSEDLLFNTIIVDERKIGIKKGYKILNTRMNPNYIQITSKALILDQNNESIDENTFFSEDDTISLSEDVEKLIVTVSYNRFHTGPIGYQANLYYSKDITTFATPMFHYFSEIGSQDMPHGKLLNTTEDTDSVVLQYEYYESIGFPDMGRGTITITYNRKDKAYILDQIKVDVKIRESAYDGVYPLRGWVLSKEYGLYFGDGWYPVNGEYKISIIDLNSKFRYLIGKGNFIYGIEKYINTFLATVTEDNVRVRMLPTLQGEKIKNLLKNDHVTIIDRSTEKMIIDDMSSYWYKIKDEENSIGWMYGYFLSY